MALHKLASALYSIQAAGVFAEGDWGAESVAAVITALSAKARGDGDDDGGTLLDVSGVLVALGGLLRDVHPLVRLFVQAAAIKATSRELWSSSPTEDEDGDSDDGASSSTASPQRRRTRSSAAGGEPSPKAPRIAPPQPAEADASNLLVRSVGVLPARLAVV